VTSPIHISHEASGTGTIAIKQDRASAILVNFYGKHRKTVNDYIKPSKPFACMPSDYFCNDLYFQAMNHIVKQY
jgi:hypothetical protein